jgi:hypothetical protein
VRSSPADAPRAPAPEDAYASIRQHTPAHASIRSSPAPEEGVCPSEADASVSIRQHTSACASEVRAAAARAPAEDPYVSSHQHTQAYASIRRSRAETQGDASELPAPAAAAAAAAVSDVWRKTLRAAREGWPLLQQSYFFFPFGAIYIVVREHIYRSIPTCNEESRHGGSHVLSSAVYTHTHTHTHTHTRGA